MIIFLLSFYYFHIIKKKTPNFSKLYYLEIKKYSLLERIKFWHILIISNDQNIILLIILISTSFSITISLSLSLDKSNFPSSSFSIAIFRNVSIVKSSVSDISNISTIKSSPLQTEDGNEGLKKKKKWNDEKRKRTWRNSSRWEARFSSIYYPSAVAFSRYSWLNDRGSWSRSARGTGRSG